MKLVVGNVNGGVAKTVSSIYLATALARQGRRVLLADADVSSAASADWANAARDDGLWLDNITVQEWTTPDAIDQGMTAAETTHDDTVVDTGPQRLDLLRVALVNADALLIPTPPYDSDLRSLPTTFVVAAKAGVPAAYVLLVNVQRRTRIYATARTYLARQDLPVLTADVPQRVGIPGAWGTAPTDLGPYADVLAELTELEADRR